MFYGYAAIMLLKVMLWPALRRGTYGGRRLKKR